MKEKEKGLQKNKPHIEKAAVEMPNLDIKYQEKEIKRKKQQKNIKDVMIMMIMMMMILMMT